MLLLLLLALVFTGLTVRAEERGLPIVVEQVDEIAVVDTGRLDDLCVVVFVREGRVLATRLQDEEMLFVAHKGGFWLIFQDYHTAHRAVWTPRLGAYDIKGLPSIDGPWFAANRNMRDLKQPEAP